MTVVVTAEHLGLVRAIANDLSRSISPIHVEWSDLFDAGMCGLIGAAQRYRADMGASFSTYARHRIRGAMLDELRSLDRAGRDTRRLYKRAEEARQLLTAALGRQPDDTEIRLHLGLSPVRWTKLLAAMRSAELRSMQSIGDPGYREPRCPNSNAEQLVAAQDLASALDRTLHVLPRRTGLILHLYYRCDMTMRQISRCLHLNESRISQIHAQGLSQMRDRLKQQGLSAASFF
jgi:RNA polymerase sigma factor for flagellar operon FliA